MRRFPSRLLQIFGVLLPLVLLDQATKRWAVATLWGRPVQHFFGDLFRLGYAENSGVFLGWGDGLSPRVRFTLFVLLVGIALVAALVYALRSSTLERRQVFALAAIIGGGCSNLGDRIAHQGVVIDFLNLGVGKLRTGVFNVADMAVTGGVLFLLFVGIVHGDRSGGDRGESSRDAGAVGRGAAEPPAGGEF